MIETDGDRIVGYREKPSLEYDVSMGIYVYDERALAYLPDSGPFQFPELVQRLVDAERESRGVPQRSRMVRHRHAEEHQRAVDAFEGAPRSSPRE